MTLRVGVLVSGSGTNLESILAAERNGQLGSASVVLVVANRPDAFALTRAQRAGIPTAVVDHKRLVERASFDAALIERLAAAGVDLVVLAGFMRLLTGRFLAAFPGRVINIHPALLPSFPGVDGQGQALRHGVRIAGCSVHFVDEGTDSGPIIAQTAVPVLEEDSEEDLKARILAEEHLLLPTVIRWFAQNRVRVEGRRVRVDGSKAAHPGVLRSPEVDE